MNWVAAAWAWASGLEKDPSGRRRYLRGSAHGLRLPVLVHGACTSGYSIAMTTQMKDNGNGFRRDLGLGRIVPDKER